MFPMSIVLHLWRSLRAWRVERALDAMNRKAMIHPHRRAAEARAAPTR